MAKSRRQKQQPPSSEAVATTGVLGTGLAAGAGGFTMCPIENQTW